MSLGKRVKAKTYLPGPWRIAEEVGASRPFTCYRRRNGSSPFSTVERMKSADGREATFATEAEALAAIARSNH